MNDYNSHKPKGPLLVRNTILNSMGQILPLIIGVITIPVIINGMGNERFGVLSLTWVALSYISFLNLGLGRATTKFVAEYLSQGKLNQLPQIIWTSVAIQFILGLLGGLLFTFLVPVLVDKVFAIPPALMGETRTTFLLVAMFLPVLLITPALRGILEAGQRFEIVNLVRIPANSLIFLIPAVGIFFNFSLPDIVFFLLLSRLMAAGAYLFFSFRLFPFLKQIGSFKPSLIRPLFTYGGWVSISVIVSPFLLYLDRFLIGSILTIGAVTYYTAPFEMLSRLTVMPGALATTLFPAFSSIGTTHNLNHSQRLYKKSFKSLFFIMGAVMIVMFLFANDILFAWLGREFAEQSTAVFQILCVGILINSVSFLPFTFLQGLGRPDLTAKFHLIELPIHVILMWFLVKNFGITGAALAWTIRVGIDAALLFGASWKVYKITPRSLVENNFWIGFLALTTLVISLLIMQWLSDGIVSRVSVSTVLIGFYGWVVWRFVFDAEDKKSFSHGLSELLAMFRGIRISWVKN